MVHGLKDIAVNLIITIKLQIFINFIIFNILYFIEGEM